MKLSAYLEEQGIARSDFASRVGCSNGRISQLCEEGAWPSRELADKIAVETGGAVTADDFLPLRAEVEARA